MEKRKIMVSAYACEPYKGSEIGVGWHWVLEMSKYYELWVVTRSNNKEPIEKFFKEKNLNSDIHFIYYDLPKFILKFKKGMRGVRLYYNLWQLGVNKIIKKTMIENNIEVFHLLTYGNALWYISSFGQKKFFIWGPTGGVDTIPREYSKHYTLRNRLVEFIRRLVVKTLPINIGFRKRCKNANIILCKAESTIKAIPKKYRNKALIFTDVATDISINNYVQKYEHEPPIEYLIIGKLDAWRGYDLLIEAFKIALNENKDIHLSIMGEGSDKKRISNLIKKYNLEDKVNMIGQVSMEEYYEYVKKSDVIVNPSLKEGAVTVSFDAMSFGKPFICIDTKGYTRYFNNEYAIVIPKKKRKETIETLKDAVIKLTDVDERKRLSENIIKQADRVSWENKGKEIYKLIEESIK